MAKAQSILINKKDLKALFDDAGKRHQLQLKKSADGLKKDLVTIHKAYTAQLSAEIETVKELHAETHAETVERFDTLEERLEHIDSKLERLLVDTEVQLLKRSLISYQQQTNKRLAALEK